jgi:hypothetical protein
LRVRGRFEPRHRPRGRRVVVVAGRVVDRSQRFPQLPRQLGNRRPLRRQVRLQHRLPPLQVGDLLTLNHDQADQVVAAGMAQIKHGGIVADFHTRVRTTHSTVNSYASYCFLTESNGCAMIHYLCSNQLHFKES